MLCDFCLVKHLNMNSEYSQPPCNSFSVARNTAVALGGSQQIVPHWGPTPLEHPPPDSSEKAGEEFLRCIADNKPLPDYLKKNMAFELAEALKSASILKETLKSNPEFQKHKARSKSRSRSRGRSRAKSRCRSKSRARSRSRARSKSRVRGKSRARSRARSRSRSRSRSRRKSRARSKSRARRSRSRSSSEEGKKRRRRSRSGSSSVSSSYTSTANSLLEGLKMVMSSKDLETRLPSLKDAILNIKASDKSMKVQAFPHESSHSQAAAAEENLSTQENDSMLLPHERVGSDFSWLQGQSEEDASVQKAKQLEEEESFLYGNPACYQSQQPQPLFRSSGNLVDHKQPLQTYLLSSASSCLDSMEFEKVKNILKSLGASSDVTEPMVTVQRPKEQSAAHLSSDTAASLALPALANPNVRQALESLQSLIKATKDKRVKSEGPSQTSPDKYKAGDSEQRKPEKQDRMKKMESMEKELKDLLKQDGLNFLTPVIGFYCQKCEEFIGDFSSAEKHSAIHKRSNSSSKRPQMDKDEKDSKGNYQKHSQPSERRDHKDYDGYVNSGDKKNSGNHENNSRTHERDHRGKCYKDNHEAGSKSIFLKEEMKKERMLITVSCGQIPPPPGVRVKDKLAEERAGHHSAAKTEELESKEKPSKDGGEDNDKDKTQSSESSDDDNEKSRKSKHSKKKKKKKDKKKKKEKKEKGRKS